MLAMPATSRGWRSFLMPAGRSLPIVEMMALKRAIENVSEASGSISESMKARFADTPFGRSSNITRRSNLSMPSPDVTRAFPHVDSVNGDYDAFAATRPRLSSIGGRG